ncbi:MAG: nucleotide exchange factor GrpE [Pseudonocardiaceae bacterium]
MNRMARGAAIPAPSGIIARLLAVVLVLVVVALLLGATVTGPWWYTWRAWGLVLAAMVTGAALAWAIRIPPPQVVAVRSARAPEPATEKRYELAQALIELLALVPTDSLRYRVKRALSDAGFMEFSADGQPFDPARHHAAEVEWTDDPTRNQRVARTLSPGYSDGHTVVRAAEVLVYRSGAPDGTGIRGGNVR